MFKLFFNFINFGFKLGRIFSLFVRRLVAILKCKGSSFSFDLQIEKGAKITATDGGTIQFARRTAIDRFATIIVKFGRLTAGSNLYLGVGAVIVARDSITIGENVLIAEHVTIRDQEHALKLTDLHGRSGFTTSPVVIGNNVWLGAKVTVTQGVTIGNNVVVGANSVVTKSLPDNCVAVGVPARVIRFLTPTDCVSS